jgi:hypothetical protein
LVQQYYHYREPVNLRAWVPFRAPQNEYLFQHRYLHTAKSRLRDGGISPVPIK